MGVYGEAAALDMTLEPDDVAALRAQVHETRVVLDGPDDRQSRPAAAVAQFEELLAAVRHQADEGQRGPRLRVMDRPAAAVADRTAHVAPRTTTRSNECAVDGTRARARTSALTPFVHRT